jgi:hypothetical protein
MTSKHPKLIGTITGKNNAVLLKYLIPAWIKEGLRIIYIDRNSQDNSIEIAERFIGNGIIDLFSFTKDNPGTEQKIESLKDQLKEHYADSTFIDMKATQWIHSHTPGKSLWDCISPYTSMDNINLCANSFIFPECDSTQKWMHYYHFKEKRTIHIFSPRSNRYTSRFAKFLKLNGRVKSMNLDKCDIVIREYINCLEAETIATQQASIKCQPQPTQRSLLPPDTSRIEMLSHKKQRQLNTKNKSNTHYWNWEDKTKETPPVTIFGLYGCDKDIEFLETFYKSELYTAIAKDPNCLIIEIWAGGHHRTQLKERRLTIDTEEDYGNLSIKTQKFIQYCYLELDFTQIIKFDITCMRRNFQGRAFEGRQPLDLEKLEEFVTAQLKTSLKDGHSREINDHYGGFQLIKKPSFENIETWARKKKAKIDPRKVFASESRIPDFFTGKCYVISKELSKLIARDGYSIAHQHKRFLNGSEDLMIARMANYLIRGPKDSKST